MALQPSLRSQIVIGSSNAPHTLEIFLDYVCPFSAKIAFKIDKILKPLIGPGGPHTGKVKLIFRQQVQPWHAVSTLTHEAALAVVRVSPENFWPFSLKLFEKQGEYFDIPAQDLSIRQIREKLVTLASEVIPDAQAAEKVRDLLELKGSPNGGNAVTDDLKYTVKYSRQNGVHVSPTALWDGIIANQIGSSWEEKDWAEYFSKAITV
ncbi:hypothetical protein D9619_000705 [Psilocybe cf. subviscida]|uniref:Thioredoxin-like fold domain-containing protein n=1 Tax=Psilocybe cf. subviscida TaxID=2480587 RepID=A0A8H5BE00_9AGAR|nr:hypothetical protein D9619_000705 [Psilocybe cf. subviscida]